MDLAPFIRDLILSNECVILRGVGGFETSYRHAELDSSRKHIAPPSKHVHFRNEWIKDNGVLEKHIAESLNISREKASDHIDRYVKELFSSLKESGIADLGDIGEFFLDEKQNLQFRESENVNYLADSFGLDILSLDDEKEPEAPVNVTEHEPEAPGKRKMTAWYIVIGLLLLAISVTVIIILVGERNFSILTTKKSDKKSDVITFGNSSRTNEDSATLMIEQKLDQNTSVRSALAIDKADSQDFRQDQVSDISQVPEVRYYLVAGSFRSMRGAESQKADLEWDGFDAEIISTEDNIRVVIGEFTDKDEALAELRRIRQQLDQSVWLLTME